MSYSFTQEESDSWPIPPHRNGYHPMLDEVLPGSTVEQKESAQFSIESFLMALYDLHVAAEGRKKKREAAEPI